MKGMWEKVRFPSVGFIPSPLMVSETYRIYTGSFYLIIFKAQLFQNQKQDGLLPGLVWDKVVSELYIWGLHHV
ncbi:hypothetical protein WQ54_12945 [Bacillus sp. SA1-12]|nr:hypothetical protein WQ54_12945 [Bacillus sp. SA1-12]